MSKSRRDHWDGVYAGKKPSELTWFQEEPAASLALIREAEIAPDSRIIDVGGGVSPLPLFLLLDGYRDLSVLDISGEALAKAKSQLGARAEAVDWIEADVLDLEPERPWNLWHDRAVFHFLTSPSERESYLRVLDRGLDAGGHLIISTFALDGPTRCSGLDCAQYSPDSLGSLLGSDYLLRGSIEEDHPTPRGGTQKFVYSWFERPR